MLKRAFMKAGYIVAPAIFLAGCTSEASKADVQQQTTPSDYFVFYTINEHDFVLSEKHYDESSIAPALVAASGNSVVRILVLRYISSAMTLGTLRAVMPALNGAKSCLYFQDESSSVKQIALGGVSSLGDVVAGSCPTESEVRSKIGPYAPLKNQDTP